MMDEKMKNRKVLILYSSRYGATEKTAIEIRRIMTISDIEVKILNLRKEKIPNLMGFSLIILGSGIQLRRWTRSSLKFLKYIQKIKLETPVAVFISSGAQIFLEKRKNKIELIKKERNIILDEILSKFQLKPVSSAIFGGIYDYNKIPFWSKKVLNPQKQELKSMGVEEIKQDVFDTRNLDEIRKWAYELADFSINSRV